MKIKDLLGFNPEAEIEVIFAKTGKIYDGKLSYGWYSGDDEKPVTDTRIKAKTVSIFLGENNENVLD